MKKFIKNNTGLLYLTPWIFGFLALTLLPFIASFVLSFTNYNAMNTPKFIGLANYRRMFANDEFRQSFIVTVKYVILTVPLKLAFALFIAYILNFKMKAIGFFRTVYYIPSILGGSVAIAVLWSFLFATNGLINQFLSFVGIEPIGWLSDTKYALFTVSLLKIWQFGAPMVIFLAALKNVPETLYEAAKIDGAGKFRIFYSITLPMITPVIFFNFIMQLIQSFQEFSSAFVITQGGPLNSTYLFSILIYDNAFKYFRMGYSSALSWFLFTVIMIFTIIIFRSQKHWVHYNDE